MTSTEPKAAIGPMGKFRTWSLLTGAGFSANWGFLTAPQVWAELITDLDIQAHATLRGALLSTDTFSFEDILFDAQQGKYGTSGRVALEQAIDRVFAGMQFRLNNDGVEIDRGIMSHFLMTFLARQYDETGLIFTLNQDMLFESTTGAGHLPNKFLRPGVNKEFTEGGVLMVNQGRPLAAEPNTYVTVEALKTVPPDGWPNLVGTSNYIKLHGSWDWRSPDGGNGVIMGGAKASAIAGRPLLQYYSSIFETFLNTGDRRLLVVGYGFRDVHINELIVKGIRSYGLRLHIWDLLFPRQMRTDIYENGSVGREIWQGLCGFTQARMSDVFRPGGIGLMGERSDDVLRKILGSELD